MPYTTVYHYTSFRDADVIFGSVSSRYGRPPLGLLPNSRVLAKRENIYLHKSVTFALLEPLPSDWINNPYFPTIWDELKRRIRSRDEQGILLEVTVDLSEDVVLVGDRTYNQSGLSLATDGLPEQFHHTNEEEGQYWFIDTAIPLAEYQKRQLAGEQLHLLPEVLIFSHIPADRLTVSSQQPLLEENLENPAKRADTMHRIHHAYIREQLLPWQQLYEQHHGPLEIGGRGKERL